MSKENHRYRVRYSNSTVFVHSICIRYRSFSSSLFDIDYDIVLQYRDITISKVKTLMSYMISAQCREIRISTFSLRYQRFGRYWVRYVIPGAAGRTGHVPAPSPPMGPASWSSTRLDDLYPWGTVLTPFPAGGDCLDALSCWSSAAAFCCCSGGCVDCPAGRSWSR
jgi:hypothetical protein